MQRKFTNNLHHDKTLMFNISGFKLRVVSATPAEGGTEGQGRKI